MLIFFEPAVVGGILHTLLFEYVYGWIPCYLQVMNIRLSLLSSASIFPTFFFCVLLKGTIPLMFSLFDLLTCVRIQ